MPIGYCTNVHAGANLEQTRDNLQRHAVEVRQRVSGEETMGVGLWLSAAAAAGLTESEPLKEFGNWLAEQRLVPFTMNGFPYGDFHQPVVKHRVYEPTWWESDQLDYTRNLVRILHHILPAGQEGSISTLPIGWGHPSPSTARINSAARQLVALADDLHRLENESGRLVHLCLEPEPGCYLQFSQDIVNFFENHLVRLGDERIVRRHLRVCHDVCHAAVMFEPQRTVLERYRDAGIHVGKVQVSSAVCLNWNDIPANDRGTAIRQLTAFAEDRYLHQTMRRDALEQTPTFYEDLPLALADVTPESLTGEWRVHFHVPIYLQRFGLISTSRADIIECLETTKDWSELTHYEVETYAWGVLPDELQQENLASGIAAEIQWLLDAIA